MTAINLKKNMPPQQQKCTYKENTTYYKNYNKQKYSHKGLEKPIFFAFSAFFCGYDLKILNTD